MATPYLQTDRRWRRIKLGSSNESMGGYGCAVVALTMWMEDHLNSKLTPRDVNYILRDADQGFKNNWNLMNWPILPEIFSGIKYEGRLDWPSPLKPEDVETLKSYLPGIVYVDYNRNSSGLQQHFVYLLNDNWDILDPMGQTDNLIPRYGKNVEYGVWGLIKLV